MQCCKTCGGNLVSIPGNQWKCVYCGSVYSEESAEKQEHELKALMDSYKMERVANLRQNLFNAVNAQYISSTDIRALCRSIKEYFPDDFQACFYDVACGSNSRALAQYIRNIDVDENYDSVEHIIKFLIRSIQADLIADLNILIDRAYKNRDLRKYEYYSTYLSAEAEKVQMGIYETKLPRDVFVAYSSKDMDVVLSLVDVLESNGLKCFIAARNLKHGKGSVENYDGALKEAMDHCRSFVFVSSLNSRNLACDALGIEIPYIQSKDISNAPAEFRNNYIAIPQKYKKPRVEYRIEESNGWNVADSITNEFFDGYERVYSPEEVATRIARQMLYVPKEEPAPVAEPPRATTKLCVSCGSENPASVKFCTECGKNQFVNSIAEFIQFSNKKAEQERLENERKEKERAEKERMEREYLEQERQIAAQQAQQARYAQQQSAYSAPRPAPVSYKCPVCAAPASPASKSCSFCGTPLYFANAPQSAPAPQVSVPQPSAGGNTHKISFIHCGPQKLGVIKVIRETLGVGLKEAKDLVEACPITVTVAMTYNEALMFQKELQKLGARVEIQ